MDNLDEIEIEELRKKVKNSRLKAAIKDTAIKNTAKADAELQKQADELKQQLAAIQSQQRERDAERREHIRAKEQLTREAEEFERMLQRMLSDKAAREEFNRMASAFDFNTQNKPWRTGVNGKVAKPHQIEGGKHLAATRRAILGDKRGLGKTLTGIIYADMLQAKKILVFVPKDVSGNFEREINSWAPDRPVINMCRLKSAAREVQLEMLEDYQKCVVIVNYEIWVRNKGILERLKYAQFDTVIFDEVHTIKNHKSNVFEDIQELVFAQNKCPLCSGHKFIAREKGFNRVLTCADETCGVERQNDETFRSIVNVLGMSGTAILNKPQDIWPILNLVDQKNFRTLTQFLFDFAEKNRDRRWVFRPGGADLLVKKLGMRYLGRTPETAGVEMPKQDVVFHKLNFDGNSYYAQMQVLREIYDGMVWMGESGAAINVTVFLAELTRMRQALLWPDGIQLKDINGNVLATTGARESIKLDKAQELVSGIVGDEGDRCVVFSSYNEPLYELKRRLEEQEKLSVCVYNGSLNYEKKQAIQLDFDIKTADKHHESVPCTEICETNNCRGGYKYHVMLGQYQSGGTGLNLTGARQMVLLDRFWSPGREDQALGRIQRLDSVMDSIVHIIEVEKTSKYDWGDHFMAQLIELKKGIVDGFEEKMTVEMLRRMVFGD